MSESFEKLGLGPDLCRSAAAAGYDEPNPLQLRVIPQLLAGQNVRLHAGKGAGAFVAFALGVVERARGHQGSAAAVVCPDAESVVRAAETIGAVARGTGLRVLGLQEGRALRAGAQVVVATAARLLEHATRGDIDLGVVKTLVLNRVDEILAAGSSADVESLLDRLPADRSIVLVSENTSPEVSHLVGKYLNNQDVVEIADITVSLSPIRHRYCIVPAGSTAESLGRFLQTLAPGSGRTVVFCRSGLRARAVTEHLCALGYFADCFQTEAPDREQVLQQFRAGELEILVTTDAATRGVDVGPIARVVNGDIPWDSHCYARRDGALRPSDEILTLVDPRNLPHLQKIERLSGQHFLALSWPAAKDPTAQLRAQFKDSVRSALAEGALSVPGQVLYELSSDHDPVAIAMAALGLLWKKQTAGATEISVNSTTAGDSADALVVTVTARPRAPRPTPRTSAASSEDSPADAAEKPDKSRPDRAAGTPQRPAPRGFDNRPMPIRRPYVGGRPDDRSDRPFRAQPDRRPYGPNAGRSDPPRGPRNFGPNDRPPRPGQDRPDRPAFGARTDRPRTGGDRRDGPSHPGSQNQDRFRRPGRPPYRPGPPGVRGPQPGGPDQSRPRRDEAPPASTREKTDGPAHDETPSISTPSTQQPSPQNSPQSTRQFPVYVTLTPEQKEERRRLKKQKRKDRREAEQKAAEKNPGS